MLNVAAIMGRLTSEPELRTTGNGISVCSVTVAVDRNYQRQGQERETDFINVVAWRQTAEFLAKYFRKGQMIAVNGSIQTRNYEDRNGNKRTAFEILADNVSFCGSKAEQTQGTQASPPAYAAAAAAATAPAPQDTGYDEPLDDDELPF